MTEPEDQIRRYVDAVARNQAPVEISEIAARRTRRRPGPRVLVGAVGALCAVLVAGLVVVDQSRQHHRVIEVSPSTTAVPGSRGPARPCAAASLPVTSTQGERLHPSVLPPGFHLTEGSETDLGAEGGTTYSTGTGGQPRIQLARYHTSQSLTQMSAGASKHHATVQGHDALVTIGPIGPIASVAWIASPGLVLEVWGYNIPETELLSIADGVRYEPGTPFTYPEHVAVLITRDAALTKVGSSTVTGGSAVLSSVGEVETLAGASTTGLLPRIAATTGGLPLGVTVATPVWVVSESAGKAGVIDAYTGANLAVVPRGGRLDALTDRSGNGCEPPFGVLTRSEVLALHPPGSGVTETATLTTLSRFGASGAGADFVQCAVTACDANVPVWVLVSKAADHRFTDGESRPPGRPATTVPVGGSWQVIAVDARTGPQDTELATVSSGPGSPPRSFAAIKDLAGP